MKVRPWIPFIIAGAVTLPGIVMRLAGYDFGPEVDALAAGTAILGASFILLWACDAAQADISQALALAVVAFIAVLPEYAVDMYFTWQAGQYPESNYAHYAIANMTGANRLLIGVAWGAIALLFWIKQRRAVRIGHERRLELIFLGMATAYAFVIPLKGTLAWYDGLVFLALYGWYIVLAGRRQSGEFEPEEGPAKTLVHLPKWVRRATVGGLFLFAAGAILANAKPFCEGLVDSGKALHINEFLLVQWLAPIASEAPEFIVALVFAWRSQASMALGSLLSSKLNQWTLLVGMIPGVFALSHGSLDHPIPMGSFQMDEILLTAAQSLFAVVMLASLRLSVWGALALFVLFAGQLVMPGVVDRMPDLFSWIPPGRIQEAVTHFYHHDRIHELFAIFYCVGAVALVLRHPRHVWQMRLGLRSASSEATACELSDVTGKKK
jgi:cation:H+ antiporter